MTRSIRLADAHLPEALESALAAKNIGSGFVTATAVLEDVELRVFDPVAGRPGVRRKIAGRVEAVTLAGAITKTDHGPLCVLRAVLSRETDTGIETFAGHIAAARVVSMDGWINEPLEEAIDVASPPRDAAASAAAAAARAKEPEPSRERAAWTQAAAAAANEDNDDDAFPPRSREINAQIVETAPMPRPPTKPKTDVTEEVYPEAGDLVDHFAFGRCEVVKSDGDRLHVKIPRDGRIKEIALEMLRVSPRPDEEGKKVYKLDRRM
jgi:predicted DNA-binding protein with PD1-like motif